MRTTVVAAVVAALVTAGSGGCGPEEPDRSARERHLERHASNRERRGVGRRRREADSPSRRAAGDRRALRRRRLGRAGLPRRAARHLQLVRGFDVAAATAATRSRCAAPTRRARSGQALHVHDLRRLPGRKLCSCIRFHHSEDGADDSAAALLDRGRRAADDANGDAVLTWPAIEAGVGGGGGRRLSRQPRRARRHVCGGRRTRASRRRRRRSPRDAGSRRALARRRAAQADGERHRFHRRLVLDAAGLSEPST